MADSTRDMALDLFRKAYQLQMQGELDLAVEVYKKSISVCPTAEAYTFLGWTYRFQGKLEEAIAACKQAIEIDPEFGNPYNDIGSYLIDLNRADEAIAWLEKATMAPRYDAHHYPWYNLGRIYMGKELYRKARECFEHALDIEPEYNLAAEALQRVRRLIQ